MGGTSGAGTAYSSGTPDSPEVSYVVLVAQSLVFCAVFYRSLFVLLDIKGRRCQYILRNEINLKKNQIFNPLYEIIVATQCLHLLGLTFIEIIT